MFTPDKDGITHINVYTKGQTNAGKLLTNLSNIDLNHPEYGYFKTLESLWFWLVSEKDERFRHMNGFEAKKQGKLLIKENTEKYESLILSESFRIDIKKGIEAKLRNHTDLLQILVETKDLPLTHYYFYSPKDGDLSRAKVIPKDKHQWQIDIMMDIRSKTIDWMKKHNILDISTINFK